MKLPLLDRMMLPFAPVGVADRLKARAQIDVLRALDTGVQTGALTPEATPPGMSGDRPVSNRWWRPLARDAKADTLMRLPLQRAQSRELARTSPIAVGAINTNVDRVVGTGLALSAEPSREVLGWTDDQALAWKRLTQNEFSLWSDSPESDQCDTLNFYQQQALVLRGVLESGDCFTLLPDGARTPSQPYALRLQVIEADRVGPELSSIAGIDATGGVRTLSNGAPQAYFIYDQHPGSLAPGAIGSLYKGQWVSRLGPSGRRRVLHHFRKLRPDMPRGVPYLAPIVDLIKQMTRYTEAEIMAAVISAYFTVFIETPGGDAAPVFDGAPQTETNAGTEVGLGMGAVVGLAAGEKAAVADPARPNPNFDPFIQAVIQQMGMALGIPHELLVKKFDASYSASKAALLDAWVYFRSVRTWLALSFCQPIYETWLAEAVATGRIAAPGFFTDPLLRWGYTRAAWHGDSMGSISPKDEVAAYTAAIDARLMTRERAEWELFGSDWNGTFDLKKSENDRLSGAGMLPIPKAGAAAPHAQPTEPAP